MLKPLACASLGLSFSLAALGQPVQQQPSTLFAQLGLTPQQVAAIDEGRPVAKVLSWGGPSEAQRLGARRVDRRQRIRVAKDHRRQDPLVARKRACVHQANGRTIRVLLRPLTSDYLPAGWQAPACWQQPVHRIPSSRLACTFAPQTAWHLLCTTDAGRHSESIRREQGDGAHAGRGF